MILFGEGGISLQSAVNQQLVLFPIQHKTVFLHKLQH